MRSSSIPWEPEDGEKQRRAFAAVVRDLEWINLRLSGGANDLNRTSDAVSQDNPEGDGGGVGYLNRYNNLSDLTDLQQALINLGIVNTTGGSLFLQVAQNLGDLSNVVTARSNLGLGSLATQNAVNLATQVSGTLGLANGGTGGTDAATARTSLGLGTIAVQNASAVAITGGTLSGMTSVAMSGTDGASLSGATGSIRGLTAGDITMSTYGGNASASITSAASLVMTLAGRIDFSTSGRLSFNTGATISGSTVSITNTAGSPSFINSEANSFVCHGDYWSINSSYIMRLGSSAVANATIAGSPLPGAPLGYIAIDLNGTIRYLAFW